MAAHFVESGKDEFVEFLYENLNSENDQIRQQSAIALGKLGDAGYWNRYRDSRL